MPGSAEDSKPAVLRTAAVLTAGTELTDGLRTDTNSAEVASALSATGHVVMETASLPDDTEALAAGIERLLSAYDTVVVTGGLGPTHDDVTRDAAALALGVTLAEDPVLRAGLEASAARHRDARAREQVFRQALVIPSADVIPATTGTAPGLVIERDGRLLALLPGPPAEMRPMLAAVVARLAGARADTIVLPCAGISESDAQVTAERVLGDAAGVSLTVLARPAEVEVLLADRGAGSESLTEAARRVRDALGPVCYAEHGRTLAEAVLTLARERGWTISAAESCTGGMIAERITAVPGASEAFLGGVVSYSNGAKQALLGVSGETLAGDGAVSAAAAAEMAAGARRVMGADLTVSVTGIAGPGGGTREKPVGLVWFALDGPEGRHVERRDLLGDREGIRTRATVVALDLLRRYMQGSLRAEGPA